MGTATSLRQVLRSICGTPWKYAVFWKLKHHSRMLLAWEEGYCENSKQGVSENTPPQNGIFNGTPGIVSFGCKTDAQYEYSTGCPIELAVTNMRSHLYSLGEGIVGNVASTKEHRWVFATHFNSKSLQEYPEEWRLQIAAGIKTILLVPVVPHGVVQLGSLQTVAENLAVVTHIQELFDSLQDTTDTCTHFIPSEGTDPFPRAPLMRNISASLVATGNLQADLQSQLPIKRDMVGIDIEQLSEVDIQHTLGMDLELREESSWNVMYDGISVVPTQADVLNHFFDTDNPFLFECKNSCFSTEDIFLASPQCNVADNKLFSEQSTFLNSYKEELQHGEYASVGDDLGWPSGNEVLDTASQDIYGVFHDLTNSELQNSLRTSFLHNSYVWPTLEDEGWTGPDGACRTEETNHFKSSFEEFNGLFTDENEAGYLLGALVANTHYASDETAQNLSRCARSSSNSLENCVGSCVTQDKCENDILKAKNPDLQNPIRSGSVSGNEVFTSSPGGSPSKSGGLLTNEEKRTKEAKYESNKNKKSSHVGKKRSKAGDIHRARPRDRQLIQDRVKELRDLVPNGAKCSIDSLLERTIKHMLFLRSVSSQAEKLKNCAHPRVSGEDKDPRPQLHRNGVTWAYELGSQPEVCPIFVENLEQPGHMLVEMLCTDYGDFLEIAQVIKHSELNIVKGVMENRCDKSWARFIVEASRGFDRMDILWPLMRLMQQSCHPITSRF